MEKIYNFSAGPSVLPGPAIEQTQRDLINTNHSGISILEMSHRSKEFSTIIDRCEQDLRDLMSIPSHFSILFLQGGASTQFAMVPLNLFGGSGRADFVNTGNWSTKAINEARRYGEVNVVASSEDKDFSYIPEISKEQHSHNADFFHITMNNTIYGTRFTAVPETGQIPLVADVSSNILSEAFDISRFGIVYAGAQKNIAPAGLTIVIIRNDLLDRNMEITPTMLKYKTHVEKKSLYNTPPCFCIYFAGLVFKWIKERGGIPAIEKLNCEKAALLYEYLDGSSLFHGTAQKECRSLMNVPFLLPNEELTDKFITGAELKGCIGLRGHRSIGGLRASLYNAMPADGVRRLVDLMEDFEQQTR